MLQILKQAGGQNSSEKQGDLASWKGDRLVLSLQEKRSWTWTCLGPL